MKLTPKSVATAALPAGKSDYVFWDDSIAGFGLRLRDGGARTYLYRYNIGTKQRSLSLGSASAVPLALARANAGELQAKVRLGADPAADKQRAQTEAGNTVGSLIDQYLDVRKDDWRHGTARQVRHHLLRHARPLHGLPIAALTLRDVAKLLNGIATNSGNVAHNRVRSSLEKFVGWTIQQGHSLPQGNVVSNTAKRPEKTRDRVLNDVELKAVWSNLNEDDYGAILKLLILCGQREAEIGGLRWDEIKDDRIELGRERTKNKRPHSVPLSDPARALIEQCRILGRTYVFGRDDRAGFKGWGPAKQRLLERIAAAGTNMAPWTVHDLRRSAATGMATLGVQPHIIEAVLNHVSGHRSGVAGIYNRATYDREKREALSRWAEHVLALVEDRTRTVVPMKRGA
jgi:integrase